MLEKWSELKEREVKNHVKPTTWFMGDPWDHGVCGQSWVHVLMQLVLAPPIIREDGVGLWFQMCRPIYYTRIIYLV